MHKNKFKTVGLIGRYSDANVGEMLKQVRDQLQQRQINVLLDEGTATLVPDMQLDTVSREELGKQSDLIIVIGGDGTLLNAARSLANHEPPLLGVNLGRLGFLTDITPDRLQQTLDRILDGHYREERRFLLHAAIMRDGAMISESYAFNDVVVHKWDIARMIEIETYIDGHFVSTMRADGLIVSTPTGSTAYALSGGGPIIQPCLDAVELVPICPHTMSYRPIVVAANSHIEVVVTDNNQPQAQVTCDGQFNLGLMAGDHVSIEKHANEVTLIHPENYDYFKVLRTKLHWGKRL